MSSERVDIWAHQVGWVIAGASGYDEVQSEVIRKLRNTPVSRINPTATPGIICENCPFNPAAPNFKDERICDPFDPSIERLDQEIIDSMSAEDI